MVVAATAHTLDPHLLSRREVCERLQAEAWGITCTTVMRAGEQGSIILNNL